MGATETALTAGWCRTPISGAQAEGVTSGARPSAEERARVEADGVAERG
jgi:hypothetical protein